MCLDRVYRLWCIPIGQIRGYVLTLLPLMDITLHQDWSATLYKKNGLDLQNNK